MLNSGARLGLTTVASEVSIQGGSLTCGRDCSNAECRQIVAARPDDGLADVLIFKPAGEAPVHAVNYQF